MSNWNLKKQWLNNDMPWLFIDLLPLWPYDASFPATFLAHACLNSTLTSSTYPMMFHCLLLSSILYPIWFPQSHNFSPLSILSQLHISSLTPLPLQYIAIITILMWSRYDVIMARLRLTAPSNCFPHPFQKFTKSLSTFICCPSAYGRSHSQLYPPYLAQILRFRLLWSQNDVIMSRMRVTATSNCFPHPY